MKSYMRMMTRREKYYSAEEADLLPVASTQIGNTDQACQDLWMNHTTSYLGEKPKQTSALEDVGWDDISPDASQPSH